MKIRNFIKCSANCWCEFCKQKIIKDEHYLRFDRSAYQRSFRINICIGCLKKISKEINRTELKNKLLRETANKI